MLTKLWFRFGIPLGSATVLAALLDFAMTSYWFLNDLGSYIYFHWDHEAPTDYRTTIGLITFSLKFCLAICLWIFILLGQRGILLFWIPLSVITDCVVIGHGLNNLTHYDFVSDEIWFLNLAIVIILRLYITIVIYQAFYRLLQNAKTEALLKEQRKKENSGELLEVNISNGNSNSKGKCAKPDQINGNQMAKNDIEVVEDTEDNLDNPEDKDQNQEEATPDSPRYLLIEPIGESPSKLFEFYNDTPRLGAAVLVIFELIWNIFALSTHSLTEFMLGGRIFFMPREEEIFMRVWRIIVDLAAIYFIFERRKTLLRFWLIVYFWTIFGSLCIFVYVMADWLDPPIIVVINVFTIWLGDNFIRFGILYLCLRVTTQPSPQYGTSPDATATATTTTSSSGTNVGRSHSLRSQCRPRSRRSKASKKFHAIHPPAPTDQSQTQPV